MLKGAGFFLLVGLVAALFGFTTVAGASFAIAKILAGIFLLVFLMLLVSRCSPRALRRCRSQLRSRATDGADARNRGAQLPGVPSLAARHADSVRRRRSRRRSDARRRTACAREDLAGHPFQAHGRISNQALEQAGDHGTCTYLTTSSNTSMGAERQTALFTPNRKHQKSCVRPWLDAEMDCCARGNSAHRRAAADMECFMTQSPSLC